MAIASPGCGRVRTYRYRRSKACLAPTKVPSPFPSASPSLDDGVTHQQERGMRAFWWDGLWAGASEAIAMNYLALFAIAFGAGNGQVALLASLSSLAAAAALFPGARFVATPARRKPAVLFAGGLLSRASLAALACVPLFASGSAAVWLIIALAAWRAFFMHLAMPAAASLTADVVPMGIRGRFLASRSLGTSIAALAIAPLAGLVIGLGAGFAGWQIIWLVALFAGALSTLSFARIPDALPHAERAPAPQTSTRSLLRDLARDHNFTFYLLSTAIWGVAVHAAGPFFNVYLVRSLGASAFWVGVLAAVPSLTGIVGLIYAGRAIDTLGSKRVLVISGALIPLLPAAWLLASSTWHVLMINMAGGVLWAAFNLASASMMLAISPAERRARDAAAIHTVALGAAFVGPLLGGAAISIIGFHGLFALSAVVRTAGIVVLMRHVGSAQAERAVAEAAQEPDARMTLEPVPAGLR